MHPTTTIAGLVRFHPDSQAVPDATVLVVGTTRGAASDSTGRFAIHLVPVGQYTIRVTSITYGASVETTLTLNAQSSHEINFTLSPDLARCEVDSGLARRDISAARPRLCVRGGGLVGIVFSEEDHEFEERYGLRYQQFGCVPPPTMCLLLYNQVIFDYLDEKYGTDWRKDVNPDVYGLR